MRELFGSLLLLSACSRSPTPAPSNRSPIAAPRAAHALHATGGHAPTALVQLRAGALLVNEEQQLVLQTNEATVVLDRDVVPELAVTRDERTVLYPRRTLEGTTLYALPLAPRGTPRALTPSLPSADRPALSPDEATLVFWGSERSLSVSGMYTLAWTHAEATPARRNNFAGVRPGSLQFVPPPITHASVRFLSPLVVQYQDPNGLRVVQLSEVSP